ncbi:MAG: hypothetical protein WBZ36_07905 [Candidatus Nitrosopolaris sp.]
MKHKPGEQGEKQPARTILYDLLTQIRLIIAWDVSTPINRAYVIDSKIILQVDATVIVGAFIFLTLSNIIGLTTVIPNTTKSQTTTQTNSEGLLKIGLTTTIVIPFALSAIFVMTASIYAGYGLHLL